MKSDNGHSGIIQLPLGMNSFYAWSKFIYCVFIFHLWIIFIQSLSFICSWFILLFVDHAMMFVALKDRKRSSPIGFLFWKGADVVAYLIAPESQLFELC
jgi:hypothetical protein